MSDENWGTEADPRKYYFGHRLYRRIVNMATSLSLHSVDTREIDETMGQLQKSIVKEGGVVEVFGFSIGDTVEVLVPELDLAWEKAVICGRGKILDSVTGSIEEKYMTDMTDTKWIRVGQVQPPKPCKEDDD